MPQLPIYNSNRNVNANTTEPLRNEVTANLQPAMNLLDTTKGTVQKWSDANDVMQYTEAKANYEVAVTDIQARAAADLNYKDSDKYFKELDDAKKNNLVGISNQQVAGKAALEFDMGNRIAQITISSDFKKKQLAVNQFNVKSLVEQLEAKRLSASPASQEVYSKQIKQVLEANVASGVLSLDQADKILKGSQKTAAQAMINADPELAKKMLTQGKFPDLSPTDQVNLLQIADKAQEQRQAEIKTAYAEQKKATENIFQEKFFKDELTPQDLEEAIKLPESEGGADRGLLETWKNKLYEAQKDRITNYVGKKFPESKKYLEMMDKVFDNKIDLINARKVIIDLYKDGLTKEESLVLDKMKGMAQAIELKKEANPLRRAFSVLKDQRVRGYISDKSVEEQAEDLKEYIKTISINPQADPVEVAEEIIERRQWSNYPSFADWKKGETYNTGIGPVKFIDRDEDGMPIVEIINGR